MVCAKAACQLTLVGVARTICSSQQPADIRDVQQQQQQLAASDRPVAAGRGNNQTMSRGHAAGAAAFSSHVTTANGSHTAHAPSFSTAHGLSRVSFRWQRQLRWLILSLLRSLVVGFVAMLNETSCAPRYDLSIA